MKTATRPRALDKDDPRKFEIFSGATKAVEVKDDAGASHYYIEGTASSSVKDRMGDILDEQCQASMLAQSRGLTMWLNHSYKVPEDILGTCVESTLERATDPEQGECLDLLIRVEIDPENPRALKSWQHIQKGTKLAFSVGGYFTDAEIVEDPDDSWNWHYVVSGIELLEISLVGIPANPRAYTEELRAYVVAQAEQIIRESRAATPAEARMLVKKSLFGGSAVEEVPVNTCAQDGCIETAAKDSPLCTAHRDAAPAGEVTPAISEAKALSDMQSSSVISAMKCLKSAVTHGMCTESAGNVSAAHAIVKALLPDDTEIPDDADLDDESAKAAVVVITLDADLKAVQAQIEAASTQLAALVAQIEQKSAEVQDLEQKAEQLKATPAGRSTQSTYSGGSSGNEPTADASLYYKPTNELAADAARQSPARSDARAQMQAAT